MNDNKSPERLALDRIHAILDGEEWDASTIEEVAEVIVGMGYVIRDPNDIVPLPDNVMECKGEPAWESLTNEQRASIVRVAERYPSMQMWGIDNYGAMMVTGYYESGGSIMLGVEPDGYTHS